MGMPRNRRETEIRERKIRIGVVTSCAVLGLLGIIACGYGHAALSRDLMISGEATMLATEGGLTSDYMQDLTPAECLAAKDGTQKQMADKRDGKIYWVAKVGDICLMTQDLRYDFIPDANGRIELTSELTDLQYSDVAGYEEEEKNGQTIYKWNENSKYPPTETVYYRMNLGTNMATTYSVNLGEYVMYAVKSGTSCSKKTGPEGCPQYAFNVGEVWETNEETGAEIKTRGPFTAGLSYVDTGLVYDEETMTYDAHFLLGNYYQYMAATAGTAVHGLNRIAPSSICPRGWKLPRTYSNAVTDNQINAAFSVFATNSSIAIGNNSSLQPYIYGYPLYMTAGGDYIGLNIGSFGNKGGYYSDKNTHKSYVGTISSYPAISSAYAVEHYGHQIRCILREAEEE